MPARAGCGIGRPSHERHSMLFLVVSLFLFGALLGTAGHVPVPVTVLGGIAITAWLTVFFWRERRKSGMKGASR
ncbi:hypothetical protein OIU81_03875 [Streptomyces sp. NBC_01454]|uniref:hypothetical protein n=2 Tax=Streptomyces TaxID=1883 RepID=UPI002E379F73|nr:hypothetical protein [Streptomyces sp. NBC_01454]